MSACEMRVPIGDADPYQPPNMHWGQRLQMLQVSCPVLFSDGQGYSRMEVRRAIQPYTLYNVRYIIDNTLVKFGGSVRTTVRCIHAQ